MRLIDIVETLVSEGHKITFRQRSDGGIIVTSIDGVKYKNITEGNRTARSMVIGGELSVARTTQLQYNVQKFIKLAEGVKKATGDIDEEVMKKLRRVQRLWRKNKTIGEGKVTKKRVRWYLKTYGKETTMEYLESRERYSLGYAYEENVRYLVKRIQRLKQETSNGQVKRDVEALASNIWDNRKDFKEAWITPCYEAMYGAQLSVETKIENIKAILPPAWFK